MGKIAVAMIVLGLGVLIALAPWFLVPVCDGMVTVATGAVGTAGKEIPMKCYWAGRAASGLGGVITAAGLLLAFVNAAGIRAGVGLMLVPVSVLLWFVAGPLIGVCAADSMPCRLGTLPVLRILSACTLVAGLSIAWSLTRQCGSARR